MINSVPEVKFEIIKEITARDNNMLKIRWLCEVAGVSRSEYYRWKNAESMRNARTAQDKADFDLILKAFNHRGYDKGARSTHHSYSTFGSSAAVGSSS